MNVPPVYPAAMPRIITETDDFIAVEKPHGMKTAPLRDGAEDDTLLAWIISRCPQCAGVVPDPASRRKLCEHGLLHRLDTATHGIVIAAKTGTFFDFLLKEQRAGHIVKTYRALAARPADTAAAGLSAADGYPPPDVQQLHAGAVIRSAFRPYGTGRKSVRPVTPLSGRAAGKSASAAVYETRCLSCVRSADTAVFEIVCSITAGFRHQIRCHLAWLGYPIIGDLRYGGIPGSVLELHAEKIEFPGAGGIPVVLTL